MAVRLEAEETQRFTHRKAFGNDFFAISSARKSAARGAASWASVVSPPSHLSILTSVMGKVENPCVVKETVWACLEEAKWCKYAYCNAPSAYRRTGWFPRRASTAWIAGGHSAGKDTGNSGPQSPIERGGMTTRPSIFEHCNVATRTLAIIWES